MTLSPVMLVFESQKRLYALLVRYIWHLKGVILLRSPGGDLGAKKKKKKQKRKKEKPSSGGTKSDSASDSQEIKVSALYNALTA